MDSITYCPDCKETVKLKYEDRFLFEDSAIFGNIYVANCPLCTRCVGVYKDFDKFLSLESILNDKRSEKNGWYKVDEDIDDLRFFVLNQIIYKCIEKPDLDFQIEFAYPPYTDLKKIVWINGQCVGCYSAKYKGTLNFETMQLYSMHTLDTIFIRRKFRRKGLATSAVFDLMNDFPKQNIGFSYPISLSMKRVLNKHLTFHPEDRDKFWQIYENGDAGDCKNIWIDLKSKLAQNKV